MLRSIIVANIFFTMYSTECYEQPIWDNLILLKKTGPHVPDGLPPFEPMVPPYSRYEIQPGSRGMFSDIAQGIQTRMKGVAKGPYIIVFDYGGIAPKYFSIIEDMASGSGIKVGPLGTVAVEPPSIAEHIISSDERVAPVQSVGVGRLSGTRSYLKPHTGETISEISASTSNDDLLTNNGITWKLGKIRVPSTNDFSTSSTTIQSIVNPIANTKVSNIDNDDPPASNGIVSMMELIMKKPTSSSDTIIPPSSVTAALESFIGGENIPSTTDTVVPINDKLSQANEPSAADSVVKAGDGTSAEGHSESEIGRSILKDIDDGLTSSNASVFKVVSANPGSSLKGDISPSSVVSAHESVNSEENIPLNIRTVETAEGEHSLLDVSSADEGVDRPKRIDAKPSAITLASASTVESPVEKIVHAPITTINGDNSSVDGGITPIMNYASASKESIPSGTTASTLQSFNAEKNIPLLTNIVVNSGGEKSLSNDPSDEGSPVKPVDRASGKDPSLIKQSMLQGIKGKPSTPTLPVASEVLSTTETFVKTPVSILKDEMTANDQGTSTLRTTEPRASTILFGTRVSIPKDEWSENGELTSTVENMVAKSSIPADSAKGIIRENRVSILEEDSSIKDGVTVTSEWIAADPSTRTLPRVNIKTVLPNYSEISASDEPRAIEFFVDMPSAAEWSKQMPIDAKPLEIKVPDPSLVSTNPSTNVLIPQAGSMVNDKESQPEIITSVPTPSRVAPGQDTFGIENSEQKSIDKTLRSDSSTVNPNLNTYVLIPKSGSTINYGNSLMRRVEKPSIATLPRTKETIFGTPIVISENNLPTKDGVASSLKWISGNSSKTSPQTVREEDVNNPVSTLNIDDSYSGSVNRSPEKLSMMNPANNLNLITPPSSTVATLDAINAAENIQSTINIVSPIEGERSLPNELNAIESPVKAVDGTSDGGTSGIGLGKSLLKGISDGVATSLATAGSGFASMMKMIMSPSAVTNTFSQSTTAATPESTNTEENVPLTTYADEGGRALPSLASMEPHMTTVDWAAGKDPNSVGLNKSHLGDSARGMKNGLDGVRTIEFPRETPIKLLQPYQQVSVADKSTNEIKYFTAPKNRVINAKDAEALYISLKPITTEVSFIIKSRGFNCVPLKLTKLNLNLYLVDSVVFGDGNICGLENMQPGNTVTITKDVEEAMEVTMPLLLKDLTVRIDFVDVSNYFFTLIKGQPIEASVKQISCKGTFTFRKGTPFELKSFRMEWGDITGVHIKLDGALEEGSHVSGIIDNIADALSGVIKIFVSPILDEIEKQITRSILGS